MSKLALPPSGLSFSAIYLGERAGRSHGGKRGLKFVFPAGYDIALALHHRLETDARNFGGVVLFRLTDFCIHHAGALKNSVSVAPGMRQVTVTPLSLSSFRSANANESMNALVPL